MKLLITGATRGLGRQLVECLSHDGQHTIFLGCRDLDVGTALAAQLGGNVVPIVIDVTDPASLSAAAASVAASGSQLDALVNNAGVLLERKGKSFASVIDQTMLVNLQGVVRVTEALIPQIRDGGQVINISSGAGTWAAGQLGQSVRSRLEALESPTSLIDAVTRLAVEAAQSQAHKPGDTPIYGLSKAGVNFYTQLMARSTPRIRFNACSPGFCRTEIAGSDADYSRKAPKEASLGVDVVVKLLTGALGADTGRFYKECSAPGTPLEAARSMEEAWVARFGRTTHVAQLALSGRSACKKCKGKIDKEELRLGKEVEVDGRGMMSWYHVRCWPVPGALGELDDEVRDFSSLSPEHQQLIMDRAGKAPQGKAPQGKAPTTPKTGREQKQAVAIATGEAACTEAGGKKRKRAQGEEDDQADDEAEEEAEEDEEGGAGRGSEGSSASAVAADSGNETEEDDVGEGMRAAVPPAAAAVPIAPAAIPATPASWHVQLAGSFRPYESPAVQAAIEAAWQRNEREVEVMVRYAPCLAPICLAPACPTAASQVHRSPPPRPCSPLIQGLLSP